MTHSDEHPSADPIRGRLIEDKQEIGGLQSPERRVTKSDPAKGVLSEDEMLDAVALIVLALQRGGHEQLHGEFQKILADRQARLQREAGLLAKLSTAKEAIDWAIGKCHEMDAGFQLKIINGLEEVLSKLSQ